MGDDGADPPWAIDQRGRIAELIDEYRRTLHDWLDGLTEEEARRRLVPSKTTLLGLVKHVTFVEGVWFDQAVTGRTCREIGIAGTVDGSFTLRTADTIESVRAAYRQRCAASRATLGRPAPRRRRRRARASTGVGAGTAGAAGAGAPRRTRRHPA